MNCNLNRVQSCYLILLLVTTRPNNLKVKFKLIIIYRNARKKIVHIIMVCGSVILIACLITCSTARSVPLKKGQINCLKVIEFLNEKHLRNLPAIRECNPVDVCEWLTHLTAVSSLITCLSKVEPWLASR